MYWTARVIFIFIVKTSLDVFSLETSLDVFSLGWSNLSYEMRCLFVAVCVCVGGGSEWENRVSNSLVANP